MSESVPTLVPSRTPLLFSSDSWRLRTLSPADYTTMHNVLASIPFGGGLNLSEERQGAPDTLRALEALGSGSEPITYLMEDPAGQAIGCVSFVVRKARLGTDILRVGHISDLRLKRPYRGAKVLPKALQICCDNVRDHLGAEMFYTGVFDHDHHAYAALTRRDDRRYQQPMAQVMSQITLGLMPLGGHRLERPMRRIELGSEATLEEVGELLARTHATSTLGRSEGAADFAARVRHLTRGDLGRIVLVREARGGALACCGVVLATQEMRRFSSSKLQGEAGRDARRFNLKSLLGRSPRLPFNRGPVSLLQLCCVAQREEEPGPLRDLFLGILHHDWGDDADWLTVSVARQSPVSRALEGLPSFNAPLSLLAVTRAGTRWNNVDFRTQRCSIEHIFL